MYGRAFDGPFSGLRRTGLRHYPDDQSAGCDDLHGRAECQYGPLDRRPGLCPAIRPSRAEWPRRRTPGNRIDPPRLSGRTDGSLVPTSEPTTAVEHGCAAELRGDLTSIPL